MKPPPPAPRARGCHRRFFFPSCIYHRPYDTYVPILAVCNFLLLFSQTFFRRNEIVETQVRFSVTLETMVVEKELTADNRNHFMSLAKDRSSPPRGANRESSDHTGRGRGTGVAR